MPEKLQNAVLSRSQAGKLLTDALHYLPMSLEWNFETFKVGFLDPQGELIGRLRIPLDQRVDASIASVTAFAKHGFLALPFAIGLIRSGEAYFGFCREDALVKPHAFEKKLRFYTVRKEHGKAQTKYLNKKGKSRGGGPIRLQQYRKFTEEIAAHLNEHKLRTLDAPNFILGCPSRIWGDIKPLLQTSDLSKTVLPFHYDRPEEKQAKFLIRQIIQAEIELYQNDTPLHILLTSILKMDTKN